MRNGERDYMILILIFLGIGFLLIGCGTDVRVKGKATYEATGEVKTVNEITLKIDVSACDGLEGEYRSQCISDVIGTLGDLVELVKEMQCEQRGDCIED